MPSAFRLGLCPCPSSPSNAINLAVHEPAHRRNAQQIARKLADEDGAETVFHVLEQLTRHVPGGP
jgi:hypothetical protein